MQAVILMSSHQEHRECEFESLSLCQCGGTTHVLRLSWSPDGQYLVSAHAMNNSGPTAQIVERDGWKTNMDFVGHRKAVTVVVRRLLEISFTIKTTVGASSLIRRLFL